MTLEEIRKLLETTGFPVAYRQWPEGKAPALPYICYLNAYTTNFAADGKVYHQTRNLQIELYTQLKDVSAEEKLEMALSDIYWEKTETYLESEKCYQILYEIEV